jgi:hypothetical protein
VVVSLAPRRTAGFKSLTVHLRRSGGAALAGPQLQGGVNRVPDRHIMPYKDQWRSASLVRRRSPVRSRSRAPRRCSSTVEPLASNQMTPVRFGSSAPWRYSQMVRHGSAKAGFPVRFWVAPPSSRGLKDRAPGFYPGQYRFKSCRECWPRSPMDRAHGYEPCNGGSSPSEAAVKNNKICSMCLRPLPSAGRAFLVGSPRMFLICRDCWKGWVVPTVSTTRGLRQVLQGVVKLRSSSKGQDAALRRL